MRRIWVLGLCWCLSGCGFQSAIIKSDTVAFADIIEDTTNKLLLLNILRARDKAPLHFADIPVLRESVQHRLRIAGDTGAIAIGVVASKGARPLRISKRITASE